MSAPVASAGASAMAAATAFNSKHQYADQEEVYVRTPGTPRLAVAPS